MRNRVRGFLLCLVTLLFSASVGFAQDTRPNIVFILADDLGWADIGALNSTTAYEGAQACESACEGGSADGMLCQSDSDCGGGGTCSPCFWLDRVCEDETSCEGGDNDGTPCTDDSVCTGGGVCTCHATPNLDALADESVRFSSFYSFPTCSPARIAFLTGQYPQRFGIDRAIIPPDVPGAFDFPPMDHDGDGDFDGIPATTPTIPTVLGEDYDTAHFGKWHIAPSERVPMGLEDEEKFGLEDEDKPHALGYDEFTGFFGAGTLREGDVELIQLCYPKGAFTCEKGSNAGSVCAADSECPGGTCTDCQLAPLDDVTPIYSPKEYSNALSEKQVMLAAKSYLSGRNNTKPFFMSVWFSLPHGANDSEHPSGLRPDTRRRFYEAPSQGADAFETQKSRIGGFASMVYDLDYYVGQLLDAIPDEQNTIVVFASDNGGAEYHHDCYSRIDGSLTAGPTPRICNRGADLGKPCAVNNDCDGGDGGGEDICAESHGTILSCNGRLGEHKQGADEGGIRVPFLLRWPGRLMPGNNATVMSALDLLPTLAHLASVDPAQVPPVDGIVIDPAVTGWQRTSPLYWTEQPTSADGYYPAQAGPFAVRSRGWKQLRSHSFVPELRAPRLYEVTQELEGVTVQHDSAEAFDKGQLFENQAFQEELQVGYRDWLADVTSDPDVQLEDPWLVTRRLAAVETTDLNGDGQSDILIEKVVAPNVGLVGALLLDAGEELAFGFPTALSDAWSVLGTADFTGSGAASIIARKNEGEANAGLLRILMLDEQGLSVVSSAFPDTVDHEFGFIGAGSRDANGVVELYFTDLDSDQILALPINPDLTHGARWFFNDPLSESANYFTAVGVADMNGDGRSDIVAEKTGGANLGLIRIWLRDETGNGFSINDEHPYTYKLPSLADHYLLGMGYFDGDRSADFLFQRSGGSPAGELRIALTATSPIASYPERIWIEQDLSPLTIPEGYEFAAIGNFDGAGHDDIAIRKTAEPNVGLIRAYLLNANAIERGADATESYVGLSTFPRGEVDLSYRIVRNAAQSICNDGLDNDGDGLIDELADPGCGGRLDSSEQDPGLACDDGLDNDGDSLVDLADPGCKDGSWPREDPHCNDGIDNDADGAIDLDDVACLNVSWYESEVAACRDGIDNDEDGLIDEQDPDCTDLEDPTECAMGPILTLALPVLLWRHRRRLGTATR